MKKTEGERTGRVRGVKKYDKEINSKEAEDNRKKKQGTKYLKRAEKSSG